VEALGLYIDGNEIKLAHLYKNKDVIEIKNLEKIFIHKIGTREALKEQPEEGYDEIFGLAETESTESTPGEDRNLFLNLLTKYSGKDIKIGMNILQSDVSFLQISEDLGSKLKNIKKNIRGKLETVVKDITDEHFNFIEKNQNDYLVFYHNNKLDLLNEVLNIRSSLKNGFKISLLDINEISLMNLFLNMVETDDKVSLVIYVGNEFSRILFFQGKKLISFSQLINEGYRSESLLTNLYGKIIFESDTSTFEEINNIYVSGYGNLSNYEKFFTEKFPETTITRFPFENFFTITNENIKSELDSFAIPISIAWKVLESKERNFIDTDFLPSSVRKQEKVLTLAWHGYVLIFLIFLSVVFFGLRFNNASRKEKQMNDELELVNLKINEISPLATIVDSIFNEITWYNNGITLVNNLKSNKMLYSDLLDYVTNSVNNVNSIWINELIASNENFSLSGNSLYRTRIHNLANCFEESKINIVKTGQILGKDIYTFNITGKIPEIK